MTLSGRPVALVRYSPGMTDPAGAFPDLPGVTHRYLQAGGLRMHIAEAGQGPLVLLLHGFPESWYSWRHQLTALADAGYHAVAPDQRGYCQTGRPPVADQGDDAGEYTILHLTGDIVALMDALGEERAVVAGHDWGAPVAWHLGLFRPDRIRGVIGLSVPYHPRGSAPPIRTLRAAIGENFYMVYFQQPGVAEAELSRDPAATFRKILYSLSGDAPAFSPAVPSGGGILDACAEPPALPGWLTQRDLDTYVAEYEPAGFTGPLNWYRNVDRSWELTGSWLHAKVSVPSLFIAGEKDMVLSIGGVDALRTVAPQLAGTLLLPGCGHWTQQERPAEVNAAVIGFLLGLG
jgi:pimeloyl-ACP methyl ester carboxylesterase